MLYVSNAFSIQMLLSSSSVSFEKLAEKPDLSQAKSFVGHPDTARVMGVSMNRGNLTLLPGDTLIVGQLVGGRLPEGATVLPEGFDLTWWKVSIL